MAPSDEEKDLVQPAVYTAKQVAELLGVSVPTVYALAASGELPSKRVRRRLVFPREATDSWINTPDRNPGRNE